MTDVEIGRETVNRDGLTYEIFHLKEEDGYVSSHFFHACVCGYNYTKVVFSEESIERCRRDIRRHLKRKHDSESDERGAQG